jgi:hypothetical protein
MVLPVFVLSKTGHDHHNSNAKPNAPLPRNFYYAKINFLTCEQILNGAAPVRSEAEPKEAADPRRNR